MKAQKIIIFTIIIGLFVCLSACENQSRNQQNSVQTKANIPFKIIQVKTIKISQIYGIGYPGNDNGLYIAANHGLKIFKDSKWYGTTTNQHDFMGFQAVNKGFLASGHPEKGLGLKDPLGVVLSDNKGKTLNDLAFYGKKNFHFMAASYSGNGIYLIGEQPSKELSTGVNYSKDNGATWKKSAFQNFKADSLGMIAVHPNNGDIMAMATRSGIYYSVDNGNMMKLITPNIMVTALTFDRDQLLFSSVENQNILLKMMNPTSGKLTNIEIPFLDYDNPITYVAVNPKNTREMAFSTYNNDVYQSHDGGKNWVTIMEDGKLEQD